MARKNPCCSFSDLDDIYHSTSMHEMQVKADMHCIDINDPDVILFLIDTTTYHAAYWPHTAKRFTAFKALLRRCKLSSIEDIIKIKDSVSTKINECCLNKWSINTPGGKHQLKNLVQVLDILNKLEKDYEQ